MPLATILFAALTLVLQIAAIKLIGAPLIEYIGLVLLTLSLQLGVIFVVIAQDIQLNLILKDIRLIGILHNRHVMLLNEMMEESKPIRLIGEQADSKFREQFKAQIQAYLADYNEHPLHLSKK